MRKKSMLVVLLLALGLAWSAPLHWRVRGWGKAPDAGAATRAAQPTRYEFVEHVIDYAHPCDDNFSPRASRNTAQATYDFTFRSGTTVGCTAATIPDGKIALNFPAAFTAGVAFTPTLNVTGTFQLRVDAQHFTVRGYGLIVDTVLNRLPKREDRGVDQDLRNAPCPLSRFRKAPPLNGGTDAAPGLNPFANNASCSVKAPDPFQDFEGNQVLLISTVDLVVGGDPIGPANYFNYTGLKQLLRFTITSKYKPATNSCPALGLQDGLADPAQICAAKLEMEVQREVVATDSCPVKITARKADGSLDTAFNGEVRVSLAPGSTPKIGCFPLGATCASSITVSLARGELTGSLELQTPEQKLDSNAVLNPSVTVLKGTAIIKAEVGSVSAMSEVNVKTPLDLRIERIEVQQGVKPEPGKESEDFSGPWVRERDLLIRVFVAANRLEFFRYKSIEGLTAQLTLRDQTGKETTEMLKLGAFAKGTDSPSQPFVFSPGLAEPALGSESLNYVHYVTQERLTLSAKLDEIYPEKDTTNNSHNSLPPLNFVASKPMVVLYSPAQLKAGAISAQRCPTAAGIAREINLMQLAYPVSLPESQGRLRFIQAPNPNANEPCEAISGDVLPRRAAARWWFWFNRTKRTDVKSWVYFVDSTYFPLLGSNATGLTDKIGGSVSIVSDRCLGPDTNTQCGILAHELGHIFGLGDTYRFGSPQPNLVINPPLGNAEGNPVGSGTYSWFHHRFAVTGTDFIDFMGSTTKPWTDRVNWNYLRTQLLPAASSFAEPEANTLAAENFVIIQGQVRKNGIGSLANCYTVMGEGLASPSGDGSYVIETLDGNATVLNRLAFTPEFRLLHSDVELEAADFSFALPYTSAVRQLRLRTDAGIQATRQISANAPTLRFTTDFGGQTLTGNRTVTWSGADADGDTLSYSLFYSPDGQLQIPLALETNNTNYEWNTSAVPTGTAPRLTLTATDGANATTIESATFTLPNRAPRVMILTPLDQQQFKTGETVLLEGTLDDPEDGITPRPRLTWTSSLQGALGTGRQLALTNLQAGTHLITAAGTDSQGARGSATLTVIVRADNFSNLAAPQTSLDFGSLTTGQTRELTFAIQNSGNAPFTVNALTSNNARFAVTAPAAPFTIAARSQREINVRFTPTAAGEQTGTLTIAANASNRTSLSVALTGRATGASAGALATVSAASFSGTALAREAIVAAFGAGLATTTQTANTLPLPTQLAGTSVSVRDSAGAERLAPLFFVAATQINFLIPPGTAIGLATITVTSGNGALALGTVNIAPVAPGLFAANANGQGVPAAVVLRVKANGAQSYEALARFDQAQNRFVTAPIDLDMAGDQLFLLLFGTGLRFNSGLAGVTVRLGGVDAPVSFAGAQGDLAGLDQVNVGVPRALAGRGEVDLVLTVDGSAANTLRVAFAGNQACNYGLSASSQNIVSTGGTGSVNVTAQNGCAWTATSNADWITITSGASGTGNGTVNFTAAANPGSQRTGTLTIAGQTFTVTQNGRPCSYSIPITSRSVSASANTGSINVTATSGCAWTAVSNASFITVTSGATGNGNGTVNYSVAANPTTSQRSGTLTIAGIPFTVTQAAGPALRVR